MTSCGGNGAAKSAEGDAAADNKLPIGLQLYSIRDDMAKDFKGTLQKVKDMGYDGVEFAGLYDNTPEQVKAMCDEIGLVPVSAHVPLADMLADIDKVIADYKTIGCQYIVVPYVTEERRPGVASFRVCGFGDTSHLYAGGESPAFSGRFCETYACDEERHD